MLLQESSSLCFVHYKKIPNSDESSLMDIDGEENGWEFLDPLLKTKKNDSYSNAYCTQDSLKNSLIDAKNKGVCTSCVLTPSESDNTKNGYAINEKGETSSRFCVICNDFKPAIEMEVADRCNHYFCVQCIKDYLSQILKESGTILVECPEKDCKIILPNYLQDYIPEELLDRCVVSETEGRVLARPKYVRCPFDDCHKVFVDDMKTYLIRACPYCWRVFCMSCRADQWHMGINCNDFQYLNRRKNKSSYKRTLVEPVYQYDENN